MSGMNGVYSVLELGQNHANWFSNASYFPIILILPLKYNTRQACLGDSIILMALITRSIQLHC